MHQMMQVAVWQLLRDFGDRIKPSKLHFDQDGNTLHLEAKNDETNPWTIYTTYAKKLETRLVIERNGVDEYGDVPSRIWAGLMNNEV